MKKLMIATVIATSMTNGIALAKTWTATPNLMTLPGTELWIAGVNLLAPGCPRSASLTIGGTATDTGGTPNTVVSSAFTMSGQLFFDLNCGGTPLPAALNIHLSNGTTGTNGVTFSGGAIDVWVETSTLWVFIGSIAATSTNIPCVSGPGYDIGAGPENYAGIPIYQGMALHPVLATVVTLPGASGNGTAVTNTAACLLDLTSIFSVPATLFLTGTVALIP